MITKMHEKMRFVIILLSSLLERSSKINHFSCPVAILRDFPLSFYYHPDTRTKFNNLPFAAVHTPFLCLFVIIFLPYGH